MDDIRQRYWDYPQEQVSQRLSDQEEFFSKSLELTEWFNSGLSTTGSFDVGIMVASPFGKLLDALPMPCDDDRFLFQGGLRQSGMRDNQQLLQDSARRAVCLVVPRQRNSEKALQS